MAQVIPYFLAFILSVAHFGYEIWWLKILLLGSPSNLYLVGHLCVSIVAALGMIPFYKSRFKIPWFSVCFSLIFLPLALLPWVGSLFYLITTACLFFLTSDKDVPYSAVDENKELFELFEFGTAQKIEQEWSERLLEELDIEPFVDILKRGDIELKKGVISKLADIANPISIKLLKLALSNIDAEVRLMASKALSGLEEEMLDDILTTQIAAERDHKNVTAQNELGHMLYRYANVGLLDQATQKFYFEKSIHAYLSSLQVNSKQEDILMLVGEILLFVQNYSKAEEIFRRVLELKPGDPDAQLNLCNALLGIRDFKRLSQECSDLEAVSTEKELYQYWKLTA